MPGLTVTKRPGLAVLSLIASKGQAAALSQRILESHGILLPTGPRAVGGTNLSAIGIGPGRWLIVGEASEALCRSIAADLDGIAAVADLSDALPVLRLSGPKAREVLAKGLPIDLHPRSFGPGSTASSVAALIPIHLWQIDDAPTYDVAVPRSLAGSFAEWLVESAAEFGMAVAG
jgi:sarcosine oxidase subunit gamma